MLRKNVAGQYLYFALVNATTGAALTGATVTARRSIDGAAQAACTGTVSEPGNGQYQIALSQADTNGNNIGYLFTATNAVPVSITATLTAADPTDAAGFGITRIDAAISSRMATYTQPTGFLAATFPGTVASPTNITAGTITTVTNLTNLPSIPANWLTAAGIAAGALDGKGDWNVGKTGYTLSTAGNEAAADALLNRHVEGGSNSGQLVKEGFYFLRLNWNTTATPGSLTVYRADGTTVAWTKTLAVDPTADPITGVT